MLIVNATNVRKEWSFILDNVIRKKPCFIKRTHDYVLLSNIEFLENILEPYSFTADKYVESDGSITLSLNEFDLVENATSFKLAKTQLAKAMLQYSEDFYNDFNYWSIAPNRKNHIPYVFKILILNDISKIEESIECQNGKI